MKHTYHSTINNLCATCARSENDHTDLATCEACSSIGNCELIKLTNGRELLLCDTCYENEIRIMNDVAQMRASRDPIEERISELTKQLVKELPATDREYHVKEITSIVAIEKELDEQGIVNKNYELAKIVEIRIQTLKERFFRLKKEEDEVKSAMIADQKYLNNLVPKLREEERAKFKDYDINYKPITITPIATARAPRMSATDKALEQAARSMNVSVEIYKKMMADVMSGITGNKCSCSITPGMCKVHPKV